MAAGASAERRTDHNGGRHSRGRRMRIVSTVIVNFRTPELTLDAVRSVLDEPETHEVIVVENGSGDDSWERLGQFECPRVKRIRSERNLGFGGGNNLGAKAATGELLFLLNSDALLQPGALRLLSDALAPAIGVVAPRLVLPDGADQADAYGPFPTLSRILRGVHYGGDPESPDWVSGAAMLLRREDFLKVGGFDERYFMYLEDTRLCWDLHRRGLRTRRVPAAHVTHLGGGSKLTKDAQIAQYLESRERFLRDSGTGPLGIAVNRLGLAAKSTLRGLRSGKR